ncbi:hypothetical protein AAFF_G00248090 [Aldrovandia affinis]|uniref:Thrombopoietin n=1 Tax=Aldrovandia affinis TaxID=143900 RepID=A0AAD7W3C0_9TELE|nr:hypothetical protein AAFF_G00248090 [Aldrovandia affinis]
MALSRVLLLLLCLAASDVRDTQARPIDFVCDYQARRRMNTVKELEAAMRECSGSALLPSPVLLPCVMIHKASWDKKSMQEKRGDIVAALVTVGEAESPAADCPGQATQNFGHVLWHLSRLLTGKLEWLVGELSSQCHVERMTSNL